MGKAILFRLWCYYYVNIIYFSFLIGNFFFAFFLIIFLATFQHWISEMVWPRSLSTPNFTKTPNSYDNNPTKPNDQPNQKFTKHVWISSAEIGFGRSLLIGLYLNSSRVVVWQSPDASGVVVCQLFEASGVVVCWSPEASRDQHLFQERPLVTGKPLLRRKRLWRSGLLFFRGISWIKCRLAEASRPNQTTVVYRIR